MEAVLQRTLKTGQRQSSQPTVEQLELKLIQSIRDIEQPSTNANVVEIDWWKNLDVMMDYEIVHRCLENKIIRATIMQVIRTVNSIKLTLNSIDITLYGDWQISLLCSNIIINLLNLESIHVGKSDVSYMFSYSIIDCPQLLTFKSSITLLRWELFVIDRFVDLTTKNPTTLANDNIS